MKKPTLKAIHPDLCRDQIAQCQPHKPKLGNKYVFANAERKELTKFEMKDNRIIKHESTTLYISNGEQSAKNEVNMYNLTTVQI